MAAYNSFVHRHLTIPMSSNDYEEEKNTLKVIAVNNRYKSSIIDTLINKQKRKKANNNNNNTSINNMVNNNEIEYQQYLEIIFGVHYFMHLKNIKSLSFLILIIKLEKLYNLPPNYKIKKNLVFIKLHANKDPYT